MIFPKFIDKGTNAGISYPNFSHIGSSIFDDYFSRFTRNSSGKSVFLKVFI